MCSVPDVANECEQVVSTDEVVSPREMVSRVQGVDAAAAASVTTYLVRLSLSGLNT